MTPHAAADPCGSENAPAMFGDTPNNQLKLIVQSCGRSKSYDSCPYESPDFCLVPHSKLKTRIEHSQPLFTHALPVMGTLYSQTVSMQSVVILTNMSGPVLHSLRDNGFLVRASRAVLQPGALQSEASRGINAIGTTLAEAKPVLVYGSGYHLQASQFLTRSCTSIFNPYSATVDALDAAGDHHGFHKHTVTLVRVSAQMIENHLFTNTFQDVMCIHSHSRPEFIDILVEGTAAFAPTGCFLSANRSGEFQLGLSIHALYAHTFSSLFGLSISQLIDRERTAATGVVQLQLPGGVKVFVYIEWKRPANHMVGSATDVDPPTDRDAVPHQAYIEPIRQPTSLEAPDTGDVQTQTVIGKLRKVVGKDILVMILGEAGMGEELLARVIHADSLHHAGPFIVVNCASIPEALTESEFFDYEEGAFVGTRKKGGIGKTVLANGGTFFLDEISDMPLYLQARLPRTLQERVVSPLGSNKLIQVDVTIVCATHRNMHEVMANGQFHEDLYYRLNGLVVRLSALRECNGLNVVADGLLRLEQVDASPISKAVMQMFRSYHWPGSIRQLGNLLRTARLMAGGAPEIAEDRLPDDSLEDWQARHGDQPSPDNAVTSAAAVSPVIQNVGGTQRKRLIDVESMTIMAAVQAHNGNISAVAEAPGISHNIIYHRIDEAGGLP